MAEMALERPHFNNLELSERLGCECVIINYMVSISTLVPTGQQPLSSCVSLHEALSFI